MSLYCTFRKKKWKLAYLKHIWFCVRFAVEWASDWQRGCWWQSCIAGGAMLAEVITEKCLGRALTSSLPFLKFWLLEFTARFAVEQMRPARWSEREHLASKERLRELALSRLEKRRLQTDLTAALQYLNRAHKKMERVYLGASNW